MVVDENVVRTLKRNQTNEVKVVAVYNSPIKAPIKKGQQLGILKVKIPGKDDIEVPLVAANEVKKVNWWGKIRKNFTYLLMGDK